MRIAIVGPGAIGSLFAGLLAKSKDKHEIFFLDKRPERVKEIEKSGIQVEGLSGNFNVKVRATTNAEEIGPVDLVLISVKSYDTKAATKNALNLVKDNTAVLTVQNGVGNIQTIGEMVEEEQVLGGITNHGATTLGYGHVRHAGKGETVIGKADGRLDGRAREISRVLNNAGIQTRITRDIDSLIWSKLIISAGINALTAITRLNNGRLTEYEWTREVLRQAVTEAVRVAKRKRIKFTYDDPIQKVESVCAATSSNVSSMLQDVLNKHRTEIDYINGAIVRQGKAFGIPTPVNEVLSNLVKSIEASYDKQVEK